MRRPVFPLIAVLGLLCAGAGLWFGGLRNEIDIAKLLDQFPRPNDTPFFRCADSFYWVSYAREMADTGKLRVRFTERDNAPYGRPNLGWASLNAWYLVALGKIWSVATGSPFHSALLSAALWANPILYLIALLLILAIGRLVANFSSAAAAVLVLGAAPRVYDDFAYAVPGHHGWHDLACFATLVCLAAAIRKSNSLPWFTAAGVCGAAAMWIGATQQAFGLAAAGAGALGGMFLARLTESARSTTSPEHRFADLPPSEYWRVFGLSGGVAAIFFYLVEYAPGSFAMRLEINHPIYALGFLLGGELLCRAQRLVFTTSASRRNDALFVVLTAGALAAIAAAIAFGPAQWHTMRQPFIQRLHREIAEFQSISLSNGREWIVILGVPIFLLVAATLRALRRTLPPRERIALFACAFPCAVAIALSFVQLRWAGLAGASAAALAAVLFSNLKGGDRKSINAESPTSWLPRISLLHACVCVSLGLTAFWCFRRNGDNQAEVHAELVDRIATMEVAGYLRTDPNTKSPIVIFSDQKIRQAWIADATGIPGVGSLYWDNPDGIRDEAEFLATYDDEIAHRIARERGITHIVTTPSGGSVIAYHYMWQGNKTAPEIRNTLAYRLAAPDPKPPPWLQLLPTSTEAISSKGIRIFRVL